MRGKYIVHIGLAFVVACTMAYSEPSVYGFNEDNNNHPEAVDRNEKTIASLKRQLVEQKERIDGLTTIVEGLSATVNELQSGRENASTINATDNSDNGELLKKLATMIDNINENYVSKADLEKVLGSKSTPSVKTDVIESSQNTNSDVNELKQKSDADLYSEGVRLFVKNHYDEAKERFTLTDKNGYKSAASNYYLGEIAYYTKKYEDAIFYFKKSAGLYDKASYIDTLLLHTAISLENTGEKDQAKAFYENIIANYGDKKTAKIAKEKLQKL